MNLAQAAESGFDFARLLGTGGPLGAAGILLGYLAKLWFDSRKERREDKRIERESEAGIVETTSAAIKLVREQMIEMGTEISVLKAKVADRDRQIDKLEERVRGLEKENESLRREREELKSYGRRDTSS